MCIRVIGLSAKMGCGKTTFTGLLLEKLPKWTKLSLGDAVKKECSHMFKFPLKWCYSEEGKSRTVNVTLPDHSIRIWTVRKILQWWGTDVCRAQDPDYWVKRSTETIMELSKEYVGVIIDDIRFPNELAMCELTARLDAYPGCPKLPGYDHPSETALDHITNWDYQAAPAYGELPLFIPNFINLLKHRKML